MRRALLHCLVPLLVVACAPDPSPLAERRADEPAPAPTVVASAAATETAVTETAPAESAPGEPGVSPRKQAGLYDLRLEDAGLPELTKAISAITGKRFIMSGPLPVIKASLYAPEPVTAEEAYRGFLTILASNGLTVVPRGRMFVIVPSPGMGR